MENSYNIKGIKKKKIMKKLLSVITLLLVLLVGNLFANPAKSNYSKITKFDDITYYWNLEATTPVAPSSKELNNWISEIEELGYKCTLTKVIPLSEALENHTGPIAEVLLARSYGCYSVAAIYENDFYVSTTFYFVSEKSIFLSSFRLAKQG